MKKVVSLFSGCGGLDLGIEGGFYVNCKSIKAKSRNTWVKLPKNRFEIVFANDIMPQAKTVWEANFNGDYRLGSIEDILKEKNPFPEADVVIGGFPCQDFSFAGKRLGLSSSRGVLYRSMVETVRRIKPKVFVAENVYGLLSLAGVKEQIIQDFECVGYQTYCFVLSAEDYGVPQTRKRVFFVGLDRNNLKRIPDLDEVKPAPTHNEPVTLGDIFKDLEEPDCTDDEEHKFYSKAKFYGKGRQGNIEIDLQKPGPTMRAEHHGNIEFRRLLEENGGLIHSELKQGMKERRLSVRECARIQTFPDDFKLIQDNNSGKLVSATHAYRLLGNAVPPLLGYHVARKTEELLESVL